MPARCDGVTRRRFIQIAGGAGLSTGLLCGVGCKDLTLGFKTGRQSRAAGRKVIILGVDGMDPRLCERMMARGELPHLARMRDRGGYRRLGSSVPPQSPVAWANFITGSGPGVHGIFDFIHRDPKEQCLPFYAAAETVYGGEGWDLGDYTIPLTFWPFDHQPTETVLRRMGTPFWDYLDEAAIPCWIYDIPSNYPPSPSRHGHVHCLSGLGVPDLLGGYGTYQYFSEDTFRRKREAGGMRKPLVFKSNEAYTTLTGPTNTYLKTSEAAEAAFRIYRHPMQAIARIDLQDNTIVLKEGEWSDWYQVDFELTMPPFMPNCHITGIVRFYLQEVRPNFRLYATPVNIDPSAPGDQRITEPHRFVTEIADELGLFYTTGFQEDHKALSNRVFSDEEFRAQADYVLKERLRLLKFAGKRFQDGLLFFYFSSTDLQAHMFWWDSSERHPVRSARDSERYNQVILDLYKRIDGIVGDVREQYGDEATIFVMSDHGFCCFRRQFNLNTWLRDNGYLQPSDCRSLLDPRRGRLVDWSRTRAYAIGLNGLYVNLAGRERDGIVTPDERATLLDEISEQLLSVRDPLDNSPVIARVDKSDDAYHGPMARAAPDLIVGYHRGYRASWATTLGDITDEILSDNDSAWSADHCMATHLLPGVLFSNKPILQHEPSLVDLAPTILQEFDVTIPSTMEGEDLFAPRSA